MASKRQRMDQSSSSRARGTSSRGNSSTSNPYGIEFKDREQRDRYNVLVKRKIVNTKYLDDQVLETLGLADDITWMLDNVGWSTFAHTRYPTLIGPTLEFLSSLNADILQGEGCEEGRITFRLFNNDHVLNLEEFNSIFSLPVGGDRRLPIAFRAGSFWNEISAIGAGAYDSSKAKASALVNPCFRYLHRVMANTLFGRGDSDGSVRQDELLFLWAMLHGVHLDTGSHMVRHLLKVAKKGDGSIVIGGLITAIAHHFDYDLEGFAEADGRTRIDLTACIAMKMIVREEDSYCLVIPNRQHPLPLPNPTAISPRNPANWRVPTADEPEPINVQQPLRPPPQTRPSRPTSSSAGTSDDAFARIHSSLDAIQAEQALIRADQGLIHAEQAQQRLILEQLQQQGHGMESMIRAMYDWHVSQHHFPPQ